MQTLSPLTPIDTSPLFLPLHEELIALLRGLDANDWTRPTVAGGWRVRDVAAHILDTDLRKLAIVRDGHLLPPDEPVVGTRDLVRLLDRLNGEWIVAARRISAPLLIELLELTGPKVAALVATLPLHEPAIFAVEWAGEERSENWMDVGREYTERWHHQMQIRDAVGRPRLLESKWLLPLLDLSVRALPRAYESAVARDGAAVVLDVGGATWSLVRGDGRWQVFRGTAAEPAAIIRADPDVVWRILYNALSPERALDGVTIEGDAILAQPLLVARSVMV